MPTDLTSKKPGGKPKLVRRIGDLVVTIDKQGVEVRAAGKVKSVRLTWDQVILEGLKSAQYLLSPEQWENPRKTLGKLAGKPRGWKKWSDGPGGGKRDEG